MWTKLCESATWWLWHDTPSQLVWYLPAVVDAKHERAVRERGKVNVILTFWGGNLLRKNNIRWILFTICLWVLHDSGMGHMTVHIFVFSLVCWNWRCGSNKNIIWICLGEISSMCDVIKNKMALKKKKVWQDFTLRWTTDL